MGLLIDCFSTEVELNPEAEATYFRNVPCSQRRLDYYRSRKMKPLFTIHAGEYLVASHIEQHFRRVNVWIPSKDTGVDLLVSDFSSRRTASLQVKFSKDFLFTTMQPVFRDEDSLLRACGWWTINREKLGKAPKTRGWAFALHRSWLRVPLTSAA